MLFRYAHYCLFFILMSILCRLMFLRILTMKQKNEYEKGSLDCKGAFLKREKISKNPQTVLQDKASDIAFLLGQDYLDRDFRERYNKVCRFHDITDQRVINCLEEYRRHRQRELFKKFKISDRKFENRPLHIAFIGDSRVREQYVNFYQSLPIDDFEMIPDTLWDYHEDRFVRSRLLNFVISFSWRPSLHASKVDVRETLARWTQINRVSLNNSVAANSPDLVIIGIALHDMLQELNGTHYRYRESLIRLKPLLVQVSKFSRVIWYQGFPLVEHIGYNLKSDSLITQKVHEYNQIVRDIFKGTNVEIWDSHTPLMEEYTRACMLLMRHTELLLTLPVGFKCKDGVHTGSVALTLATKILLNEICHSFLVTN